VVGHDESRRGKPRSGRPRAWTGRGFNSTDEIQSRDSGSIAEWRRSFPPCAPTSSP
jgi:hypothetical protein